MNRKIDEVAANALKINGMEIGVPAMLTNTFTFDREMPCTFTPERNENIDDVERKKKTLKNSHAENMFHLFLAVVLDWCIS